MERMETSLDLGGVLTNAKHLFLCGQLTKLTVIIEVNFFVLRKMKNRLTLSQLRVALSLRVPDWRKIPAQNPPGRGF